MALWVTLQSDTVIETRRIQALVIVRRIYKTQISECVLCYNFLQPQKNYFLRFIGIFENGPGIRMTKGVVSP